MHYSVCVVIPSEKIIVQDNRIINFHSTLDDIMARFDANTSRPEYLEFDDCTERVHESYLHDSFTAIRYPDGQIRGTWDPEFYRHYKVKDDVILDIADCSSGIEREISKQLVLLKEYPARSFFSFEDYCEQYCGLIKNHEGSWGQFYNPHAEWDWFIIGGRFAGQLLVKENATCIIPVSSGDTNASALPKGYRCVNGAFMKDIEWGKMHELKVRNAKESYSAYVHAYNTRDVSGLGPLAFLTEDGISGFSDMIYIKGESLEQFLSRNGLDESDIHPLNIYAFVSTNGEWQSCNNSGWFDVDADGTSQRIWNDELLKLSKKIGQDDYLTIIDCHI